MKTKKKKQQKIKQKTKVCILKSDFWMSPIHLKKKKLKVLKMYSPSECEHVSEYDHFEF